MRRPHAGSSDQAARHAHTCRDATALEFAQSRVLQDTPGTGMRSRARLNAHAHLSGFVHAHYFRTRRDADAALAGLGVLEPSARAPQHVPAEAYVYVL